MTNIKYIILFYNIYISTVYNIYIYVYTHAVLEQAVFSCVFEEFHVSHLDVVDLCAIVHPWEATSPDQPCGPIQFRSSSC